MILLPQPCKLLVIQDIVAYLPIMEQHLCIGCGNQPDLRLFYFRTDSMYKCVKIRFLYIDDSLLLPILSMINCRHKYNH